MSFVAQWCAIPAVFLISYKNTRIFCLVKNTEYYTQNTWLQRAAPLIISNKKNIINLKGIIINNIESYIESSSHISSTVVLGSAGPAQKDVASSSSCRTKSSTVRKALYLELTISLRISEWIKVRWWSDIAVCPLLDIMTGTPRLTIVRQQLVHHWAVTMSNAEEINT